MIKEVNNKTAEQLLAEFAQRTNDHTLENAQYTSAIIVKSAAGIGESADKIKISVDEFRKSVEKIGESSNRLSRQLFWLNFVLALATAVGAIATVFLIYKKAN